MKLRTWLLPLLMSVTLNLHASTLLVLGDSISAAYGMKREQGWVALLGQRLREEIPAINVVNASVSGETTSGGLSRLPELLLRHQPEWVLLELGGNDGLRGTPLPMIERNLDELVRLSTRAGATPVLLGMRIPPNYGPRYSEGFHAIYARVAEREGVARVDFLLEGVATDRRLMQRDGIHPSAAAQPQLLETVWPILQPLLVR